jgi:hypothetical protein
MVVTMKSGGAASDSPPGSTSKALTLLRVLAERGEPVQLAELVRAGGMSKPTGHRVLAQLRRRATASWPSYASWPGSARTRAAATPSARRPTHSRR